MKRTEKNNISHNGMNQLFGIDFHDFIQREQSSSMVELASEFGLPVHEVKKLKKHLGRS